MGTDALLEFKNVKGENLVNLYIPCNCTPTRLTDVLKQVFTQQDHMVVEYRAVWESILLNSLLLIGKEMLGITLIEPQFKSKPEYPLFHYVITPTDEFYDYSRNITKVIHVEITRGVKVEYNGILANADFKDW